MKVTASYITYKSDTGELKHVNYWKLIENFVFFTANFPPDFMEKVFPNNQHILDKWHGWCLGAMEKHGVVSVRDFIMFCFELDSGNREKLFRWITENYNGVNF